MKKHFLLICFALLCAKPALAVTVKLKLKISATLAFTETIKCEDSVINFNNLNVNTTNSAKTIAISSGGTDASTTQTATNCSRSNLDWAYGEDITLTNSENQTLTVSNVNIDSNNIVTEC